MASKNKQQKSKEKKKKKQHQKQQKQKPLFFWNINIEHIFQIKYPRKFY